MFPYIDNFSCKTSSRDISSGNIIAFLRDSFNVLSSIVQFFNFARETLKPIQAPFLVLDYASQFAIGT